MWRVYHIQHFTISNIVGSHAAFQFFQIANAESGGSTVGHIPAVKAPQTIVFTTQSPYAESSQSIFTTKAHGIKVCGSIIEEDLMINVVIVSICKTQPVCIFIKCNLRVRIGSQ